MIKILIITFALASTANATDCVTRKSGSVTITTCSKPFSQCRSYLSGSVIKTTCRN